MNLIIKQYDHSFTVTLTIDDMPPDESDGLYFVMSTTSDDNKKIEGADMIINRTDLMYLKAIIEAFLNRPIMNR